MKKIFLTVIALATLGLTSCELDREPETTLSDNNFWKSENDFRGACNRFYTDLDGFWHDYRADDLSSGGANNVSSGNWTVPATSNSDWTWSYERIGKCNNVIEKIQASNQTEAIKNRWMAEACFFRAYHYFELVKKYGDVPLILKPFDSTSDPEIKKARTPREEVIQQCYKDLDFAFKYLPDIDKVSSATDWGRVSKSAALGLQTRIGLYEGTFSKYHNLGSDWKAHLQKSIDAAAEMIKEGKHSLYPDFQKLFYFDGEGRQNRENVFVKVYGPNDAPTITHNNSRTLENTACVTRNAVDQFLYTDGLPREKSPLAIHNETSYDDVFKNRDPRLGMTLYKIGEEAYKGAFIPFAYHKGYSIKKGFMMKEWETNSKESVDKMIIRYAEVLLSYAEALYELNGTITDEQLDATVNKVRERAGLNVRLTNAFVQEHGLNMRDEIRREHLVEFIDENIRYNDIIRWKIAENVLPKPIIGAKFIDSECTTKREEFKNFLTDENGQLGGKSAYDEKDFYVIEQGDTRKFDPEKDYLYPIPTYEIATSDGNVVQNPKW